MTKVKNNFQSLYKARTKFLLTQPNYENSKFGAIKVGNKNLKFGLSKSENKWLDRLFIPVRSLPITTFPIPGTKKKKIYIVDGFNPDTNTVYEFLGDRWHGNPQMYPLDMMDKQLNKSYRQLYYDTITRFQILNDMGYKVFFVWESRWKKGDLGRYYRNNQDNLL